MEIEQMVSEIEELVISFRRHLHQFPELSNEEFQTQQYIIQILKEYSIEYEVGAGTGVVAYINRNDIKKCIAIRCDIDALPIKEENTCEYRSLNDNVMHACGHDAHTAMLLATAIVLKKLENSINGSVKLFFQPDEEVSSGAKRFVEEGFMNNPKVDAIFGLHVMPYLEVGEIEVKEGTLNASSTSITIEIKGQSCHAARPHLGVDALLVGSELITTIHKKIRKKYDSLKEAVLTFGIFKSGKQANIVSDYTIIKGTLRTVDDVIGSDIKQQVLQITSQFENQYGVSIKCQFHKGYPHLINNKAMNRIIISSAEQNKNINKITYKELPSMGVEDFGYYQKEAKGSFFHLGCGNKKKNITSGLHTPTFDIDEQCLKIGVELQVANIFSALKV